MVPKTSRSLNSILVLAILRLQLIAEVISPVWPRDLAYLDGDVCISGLPAHLLMSLATVILCALI